MVKIIKIKDICQSYDLHLEADLLCFYKCSNFYIVFSLLNSKELKNDFSELVNALLYNEENNVLTFAKFNIETMDIITGRCNMQRTERLKNKDYLYEYIEREFGLDYGKHDLDDDPEEELLYITYNTIGSGTAFAYYKNNTIDAFKLIDDKPFYIKIEGPEDLLNNYQEFREFIEENKANIDNKFKKEVERYQRLQIDNANRAFDKMGSEVGMNKKPKVTGRGI